MPACFLCFFLFIYFHFFLQVWILITHNPPSRLTLSLNCIHTSCSVFSHLFPQMVLLHCQRAADSPYSRGDAPTSRFSNHFPNFFHFFNSTLNRSLQITRKNLMNLLASFTCYFTCFSSPPQGLF